MNIKHHLRLYVAGQSRASRSALFTIRGICAEYLSNGHCLDIIDVEQRPDLARLDHVIIIPTLVRWFPGRQIRIVGSLSNREQILNRLKAEEPHSTGCELHAALKFLLQGVVRRTAAAMGTVHLLQNETDFLRIDAHSGFRPEFVERFRYLSLRDSLFGAAMRRRGRIIVEDVLLSPLLFKSESLLTMLHIGVTSLMCAPLYSSLGDILGFVAVYYREATMPLDSDKYALSRIGRKMSLYIEKRRTLLHTP